MHSAFAVHYISNYQRVPLTCTLTSLCVRSYKFFPCTGNVFSLGIVSVLLHIRSKVILLHPFCSFDSSSLFSPLSLSLSSIPSSPPLLLSHLIIIICFISTVGPYYYLVYWLVIFIFFSCSSILKILVGLNFYPLHNSCKSHA